MDGGDVGVLVGIALVAVGVWLGKVYGPKAQKKFDRTVLLSVLGAFALLLVLGLVWSIASDGGGSQPATAETEAVEGTDLPDATKRGCKRLAEAAQQFTTFLTGSDFDAEAFQGDFAVFSVLTIHPGAPDEIRDDLQVLDDAYWKLADALVGVDPANFDQELQKKLSTDIDRQRVMQASQNIAAWVQTDCT